MDLTNFLERITIMPCDPFDGFAAMTEHLNPEIYSKLRMQDYWLELIDRTTFPENTGLEQTVMVINNVEPPSVVPAWDAITSISDENPSGPCAQNFLDLQWGFNQAVYTPETFQLKGPIMCKDEFTFDFMPDEFINDYVGQLSFVTRRAWSNRLQEHFISLSNKYIAGTPDVLFPGVYLAPGTAEATLPAVEATSQVTQDMLNWITMDLINRGATATEPDAKGYITLGPEGPVFPMLIGMQMSQQLTYQAGPQLPAYLWASAGMDGASELMKRLGATKVLFNERHIPCMFPARYEFTDGAYVRVEPFLFVAATGKGIDTVINPEWTNATFEALQILSPYVMRSEIVQPEVNAGGLPFDPSNYYGDWRFIVGKNLICDPPEYDPLGKFGRHFAEFKHAIRPIHPDYGVTVIFKRCLSTPFTVSCS